MFGRPVLRTVLKFIKYFKRSVIFGDECICICDGLFPTEIVDDGKQLTGVIQYAFLEELKNKNLTNLTQDGRCPDRNSKWYIPDYKSKILSQ
jgi:hypothetical protein